MFSVEADQDRAEEDESGTKLFVRAIENKKREEAKADQLVRNAEISLDNYFSVGCSSWHFVEKSSSYSNN